MSGNDTKCNTFLRFPKLTLQWRHNGCDSVSQITSLTIVYSIIYWDTDQRKHQSSASLAFVRGIHWGLVNSPHKLPVTWKMFPFDDIIMILNNKHQNGFNFPCKYCSILWLLYQKKYSDWLNQKELARIQTSSTHFVRHANMWWHNQIYCIQYHSAEHVTNL